MSLTQGILSFIGLAMFTFCGLHYSGQLSVQQNCEPLYKFDEDWGNLQRYSQSNPQFHGSHNEVVFMGDSITDWMDFNMFFPNKLYVNRGIAGQITAQMLLRFRSEVIDPHPNVVIILGGTNDLEYVRKYNPVEQILENIKSMVELARVHNIQVV